MIIDNHEGYDLQRLYGSYENLDGGSTAEALEDFTGGLTETYDLREEDKSTILAMLIRGFQMGSLFGCSINVSVLATVINLIRGVTGVNTDLKLEKEELARLARTLTKG
ncbi:hypothetical protein ANCCAN_03437 [Ancylostoma caninum]|uniref:Calpain catalytic domain-containing protein n=1 Tax=Ancylostoma caninum TaxID=29170 RepID=A0A368H1D5_ANCCA|nr:hypothetical protein ANCCAN_03437 [Ancylostoma caninum]